MNVQLAGKTDLEEIIDLRYRILREPWGQSRESASDDKESEAVNAILRSESGALIACGRLQKNSETKGQVRYMAVAKEWQGRGLGKLILHKLEQEALRLGLSEIELQARENALEFYKCQGYHIQEKSFLLWGKIQHYLMLKELR